MLSLHTNNAALSAQSSISRTQTNLSTSMTRLSTGFRINSAMDDAAGLQIATRLKAQSSGMAVAMRNTQNATSMMQTAEGALAEASNILVRMKDLATQAADASANPTDKDAMQAEYDALASELTNIIGNTSFGGAKLLNGKATKADTDAAALRVTNADKAVKDLGALIGIDPDLNGGTATPTGDTGLKTKYAVAQYEFDTDDGSVATAKADKYEAMMAAKTELETAQKALVKAEAEVIAAGGHETAVKAAVTAGGGKFASELSFQIGASSSETMKLDLSEQLDTMQKALGGATGISARYNAFGIASNAPGSELIDNANASVDKLQDAINALGTVRSALGAAANRLEHANTNLSNVSANTQAAAGRIMDVDFATESANMTSKQMLMQAGTAMLKQSNSMSSMVMSLLQ